MNQLVPAIDCPRGGTGYSVTCPCLTCCERRVEARGMFKTNTSLLPHDPKERKAIPLVTGLLDYFPAALIAVAMVSKKGNDKHNPGQPLHHARGKSMDHPDSAVRHIIEYRADPTLLDPDSGLTVLAHAAWRILAYLQEELEAKGAPLATGAKVTK